jgi:hypothetical protein
MRVPRHPDKASQGTSGVGSGGHVAGVFFQNVTGTRYQACSSHGGPAGRPDRHDDRRADQLAPACAFRQHQGLCDHEQEPHCLGARIPTVDEAGLRLLRVGVVFALGA